MEKKTYNLFKIDELRLLKVGDKVKTSCKGEYGTENDLDVTVALIDSECVYFDNGYDFPINPNFLCISELDPVWAIQDTGYYVFKVYKP